MYYADKEENDRINEDIRYINRYILNKKRNHEGDD